MNYHISRHYIYQTGQHRTQPMLSKLTARQATLRRSENIPPPLPKTFCQCFLIEETRGHLPVCHFARQPLATTVHLTRRTPRCVPPSASPSENVRLTAKVTRSNAPTPRSLFRVAGSRTNNICRALILNPRERRRFDPRSPEPPVSLSTLVCTSNHLPTYLIMILRYATPFPGESDGAAPLLHMARARYMGYVGSRRGRGMERERGLIIISNGVPEHPCRCLTHVRTQSARRSRSWEQICSCV